MVYILIYKTSLTIEDSFCVQERVRIFIASQLKNLISKVSNIGAYAILYILVSTLVIKMFGSFSDFSSERADSMKVGPWYVSSTVPTHLVFQLAKLVTWSLIYVILFNNTSWTQNLFCGC